MRVLQGQGFPPTFGRFSRVHCFPLALLQHPFCPVANGSGKCWESVTNFNAVNISSYCRENESGWMSSAV